MLRTLCLTATFLVALFCCALADSIVDKFKSETDDFSEAVTYYPSRFKASNKDLTKSQKGTWRDENPCLYITRTTDGECELNFDCFVILKHPRLSDTVYIIADESKYSIPFAEDEIESTTLDKTDRKLTSRHYGERIVSYKELYKLSSKNISEEMQKSIHEAKTLRIRIGEKDEMTIGKAKLQDFKDCLELFWLLSRDTKSSIKVMSK